MKIFKRELLFRCIAILLVMALIVSSFSELAYAVDTPAAVVSEDEVTEEHITEKTKSSTTYYLGNEKRLSLLYM